MALWKCRSLELKFRLIWKGSLCMFVTARTSATDWYQDHSCKRKNPFNRQLWYLSCHKCWLYEGWCHHWGFKEWFVMFSQLTSLTLKNGKHMSAIKSVIIVLPSIKTVPVPISTESLNMFSQMSWTLCGIKPKQSFWSYWNLGKHTSLLNSMAFREDGTEVTIRSWLMSKGTLKQRPKQRVPWPVFLRG